MSLEVKESKVSPLPVSLDVTEAAVLTCTGKVLDEIYAQMIIDACHKKELPLLPSRLTQKQKEYIGADQVYVYCQEDSDIQRWTDGKLWAPSKIVGNFLHYHELYRRYSPYQKVFCAESNKCMPKFHPQDIQDLLEFKQNIAPSIGAGEICVRLKGLFVYKASGLLKKTYSMKVGGKTYHLVAYEAKFPQ
ncbi:Global transcription regulator sge1 [Entomophthora muscae]|uniref:Global transcription regulator sge1 n=2 Tax=Entomophthora muscae TaxID=34485 RepID=A0ACC2T9B3_9FUNG|nr:Global transcription regulator sge1 [Entomophthora muscae]KAJ9072158.1 Global transcription regulator sge1 [Entomophthora muscae]